MNAAIPVAIQFRKLQLGESIILSDSIQAGVTVVRGPGSWIVINLETGTTTSHERLILVQGDEKVDSQKMLSHCLGCDLEQESALWLFDGARTIPGGKVIWDSATQDEKIP